VRSWDAAKRKERRTEESGSGETRLLMAVVEGNSRARERWVAGAVEEGWGAKIFSVSDHRYSQGTGFTQAHSVLGMYPEISVPNPVPSWSSAHQHFSVLQLDTFRCDVSFLPEELSISC